MMPSPDGPIDLQRAFRALQVEFDRGIRAEMPWRFPSRQPQLRPDLTP
jgi:cytochrome c oxidase assembly protein Cox11